VPTKPLAEQLPAAVERLVGPDHRELFARLITASTPSALRRLLEPVQAAIEQTTREGATAVSVRLLLAMFACESCAEDDEMRRQFVVTLRRLTKPTLIRAYAVLYAEAPDGGAEVEQALARFGEDGAEAVADRIGSAPTRALRTRYTELLARLPGTNDALLSMLDDERESVVERAIELIVALRHPDMERVLGEQLSKESTRIRHAATRGLAAATDSSFAADALVRATQDAAPEVRLAAAVGLQSRREDRLVPAIVRRIDEEEELDAQLALVATLGRIVAPEGVQKLIALANPTERLLRRPYMPLIRLSAIEAMGEARTPAAMAALQKLLEDKEQEVRETAARLYSRARRQTTASAGIPAVSDT
jgi:HEAT repeat protein